MTHHQPCALVLAFPADVPAPPPRLADEIARRFAELMDLPPAARRIAIDEIWDRYQRERSR